MKAILEFDMGDPEDEERHRQCLQGLDALLVLNDIYNQLRDTIKYGGDEASRQHAEKWRDILLVGMDHRRISLEDIL